MQVHGRIDLLPMQPLKLITEDSPAVFYAPKAKSIRIAVRRTIQSKYPFELEAELANDWTHFLYLHRKSHLAFQLLYKKDRREIFLYKARFLFPFPFYATYIVFRETKPEQTGYFQTYLNVKTGRVNTLNSRMERNGSTGTIIGDFVFEVPRYWRFITPLFYALFKRRMRSVMHEDNKLIDDRLERKVIDTEACAPFFPEAFDFLQSELCKTKPAPDFSFEDTVYASGQVT